MAVKKETNKATETMKVAGPKKAVETVKVEKTAKTETKLARMILPIVFLCGWVFISVIASQFLVGFVMLRLVGRDAFDTPVFNAIYSLISYIIALVLIIFVPLAFMKKWKTNREELGLRGSPTWTDIGLAPVGFVVALAISAGLAAIFSVFPWFNVHETQQLGFSFYLSGGDRIIAFITLVILPPIVEEIIFRGFLYGKLRSRLSMPASILITSLLFGIIHLQWNVGLDVFALSIVLCVLREITGTIYAGILTHMLKNGIAFYLLFVL